ncbi:alpha/beta hydrolase [Azospira restricta]|uniref:Alpha/beta hydrolase n=1 Tax=Azospira restricta TaxID=404405 RepID=A0A974SPW9_9RHOO|nr:alpha/beta fold hydrolase [Azospira restricta]QRJ64313.1 alpha/beta hydrolase [Azospira restricta]
MIARRVGSLEVLSCEPPQRRRAAPLLFVHGAFAGAWVWDEHFLPWFAAQGFSAHALSLRGHGGSDGHGRIDWCSIHDYVEDVAAVAADLDAAPVLIGHSMGGFVVQKYLEHHSAPAAVLMCSVPPQGLVAAQFSLLFEKPGLMIEINRLLGGGNVALGVLREALFAQEVSDDTLARYYRLMQPESQRAIWDMSMFGLPNLPAMRRPPLLVLGAEKDVLIPPFLVQSTARTYGVPDRIFRGLGHGVMLERDWQHVAETIRDWLQEVAG